MRVALGIALVMNVALTFALVLRPTGSSETVDSLTKENAEKQVQIDSLDNVICER